MKKITKLYENRAFSAPRKKRVAAYCRVSTSNQEQLVSLEAQKAHYESYIRGNSEWELVGLYYDEGITGTKKEKRAGLLSMIGDCERGKIDLIITKSISRFARNTTDCLELVRKLLDLGVHIFFEKENLNTGSMESELMLSILSSLAESESISISENEKWGIRRRFQEGTFVISYPPYGYANEDGRIVIVPEQAEIVKQVFADTLAGKSTHAIAADLNNRGVATKRGSKWSSTTIRNMLYNEKYIGAALFQKTYTDSKFIRHVNYGECDQYLVEGHHDPIISREVFDKTHDVLRQRGSEKGNYGGREKYHSRYVFSGKIKCGECGSTLKRRLHYKPSGNYTAWCCTTHLKDVNECSMKFITDEDVKIAFVTMMNKLSFGSQFILKPLLNSMRLMNKADSLQKINELDAALEKNIGEKQVLVGLAAKGYIDSTVYKRANDDLMREAESIRLDKERLTKVAGRELYICEETKRLIKFLNQRGIVTEFDDSSFTQFVDRIVVFSREEIGFELKCGLTLRERL